MYIAYYGIAFAAKRTAPSVSLGTLLLASQLLDLLFPLFFLTGMQQIKPGVTGLFPLYAVAPFRQSLLATGLLALVFAAIYYRIRRSVRGAWVLGMLVLMHWFLDLLLHGPYRPLVLVLHFPFGVVFPPLPAGCLPDALLFVIGVTVYGRSTKAVDGSGRWAFWLPACIPLFLNMETMVGNQAAITAIAAALLAQVLYIAWAYWVDGHRTPVMR